VNEIIQGDCLEILPRFPDNSFDSVVCDPPYGLEFMSKEWDSFKPSASRIRTRVDGRTNPREGKSVTVTPEAYIAGTAYQEWCQLWAAECLRVLKPGAHLLAFGGTRTYHRMTCAIEDAGFEIRDSLHWMYGSGFPKSLDVSKAIDKAARGLPQGGANPESPNSGKYDRLPSRGAGPGQFAPGLVSPDFQVTDPDALRWDGWGTAVKPAHEPVVVARKPPTGTVAANVLEWGTGGLNVAACRVGGESTQRPNGVIGYHGGGQGQGTTGGSSEGRWPANILLTHSAGCQPAGTRRVRASHDVTIRRSSKDREGNNSAAFGAESRVEGMKATTHGDADGMETVQAWECVPGCPVVGLDAQSGISQAKQAKQAKPMKRQDNEIFGKGLGSITLENTHTDTGGASRFYPQFTWDPDYDLPFMYCPKAPSSERPKVDGIAHPTCKPVALMRWLARLVTPPGGIVLDPFAGTGATGAACLAEGFRYVLIEREPDYVKLIRKRISDCPASLFEGE
jgi:DNA modification methylase